MATAVSGDGAEELLRDADLAMYSAKRTDKGRAARFRADLWAGRRTAAAQGRSSTCLVGRRARPALPAGHRAGLRHAGRISACRSTSSRSTRAYRRARPRSQDAAFTRTILSLAASLGLPAVAEGIERPDQLADLRAIGCCSRDRSPPKRSATCSPPPESRTR